MLRSWRRRAARTSGRAVAGAEQPLEHDARVVLGHQRQRRREPRDRAARTRSVPDVARADEAVVVHLQLKRRELRLALERPGRNLVHRNPASTTVSDFLTCTPLRYPARAGVIAAAVSQRLCEIHEEARHDGHLVSKRLESRKCWRELEVGADTLRQPFVVNDAVRMVDNSQTPDRFRSRLDWAVSAGIIASSSGNATVAPTPRRIVRREIAFLVTIMILSSSSETARFSRARESSTTSGSRRRRRPDDSAYRRRVVVFQPAAGRIGQQPFGDGPDELLFLRDKSTAQRRGPSTFVPSSSTPEASIGVRVRRAPLSDRIEIFQTQPERIHSRVTARAHRILSMHIQHFAHRARLAVLAGLLERRYS